MTRPFRWSARERRQVEQDEDMNGLEVYTGDVEEGNWGVSTLKRSATGDPYFTMFRTEGEALNYARNRAFKGPNLYYRRPRSIMGSRTGPAERNPKASDYYVLWMPLGQYDDEGERTVYMNYRVLRGERGGLQYGKQSAREGRLGRQGAILVFREGGTVPGFPDKIRWVLDKSQTVDIEGDIYDD